jgi:hypothetical protein
MRYSTSNEKYLRPTRWCNPREPEVVAMANELSAYELSDYEFAEAALAFVKNKVTFEMCPLNRVSSTLKRGTGSCFHLISVWVALCRAAGIKARYKIFRMAMSANLQNQFLGSDPLLSKLSDLTGGGMLEAEGAACIDGTWIVGHPAASPEMEAAAGGRIFRLGEDRLGNEAAISQDGKYLNAIPGTITQPESVPSTIGRAIGIFNWLAPATIERMNVNIQKQIALGRKIIEEAGGREAYDQKAREKFRILSPTMELSDDEALVFKE